jgi:hypothetical protein
MDSERQRPWSRLPLVTEVPERDDLVARIAVLAAKAEDPEHLTRLNPGSSSYQAARLVQVGGVPQEELDALGRDLYRYFGLDVQGQVFLRSSPLSSGIWRSQTEAGRLASRLVARSRFMEAGAVLADCERALATNAADVQEVVALWGLHPEKPFEIRRGIRLEPLSSLLPSPPRDILLGIPIYAGWREEAGGFLIRAQPRAALTRSFRLSPVVATTRDSFPPVDFTLTRHGEMLDIARCLTLVVPRAVSEIGSWFQTEADHPLVGGVPGGYATQAITREHQVEVEPEDIESAHVRALVAGYFALPQRDQHRLRLVLDRLNAAKRIQSTREDRAVDLGVSLEALLFNPEGESQTEISFKFKMRGAVLAADDPQERKAVFKLLDRLYTLRSAAAHGGAFDPSDRSITTDLTEAVALASRMIQRALILGGIPQNWNGLILGWEKLA